MKSRPIPEPDITLVMGVTTCLVGTAIAAAAILNLMQLGIRQPAREQFMIWLSPRFLRFPLREILAALPACTPGMKDEGSPLFISFFFIHARLLSVKSESG